MFNLTWGPGTTLEDVEKQVILKAFQHFRGNKTATARALDIAVRTLDQKLEKYQSEGEADKDAERKRLEEREQFKLRQRGFTTSTDGSIIPLVPRSDAGLRVEPTKESSEKHEMPVSQRKEVQSVPSKHAPAGSVAKGR